MARGFRYYGKKRGHRRAGSPTWGVAVEGIFSALFLLAGCGGLALLLVGRFVPQWRVNREFVETTCKVLDKRIEKRQGEDGLEYRPKLELEYLDVKIPSYYDIAETPYGSREEARAILDRFELYSPRRNNLYPCWYDPDDPYTVVLVRGYPGWMWLALTVPVSFIVIGAVGSVHTLLSWGRSAERRSAALGRGPERSGGRGDRRCPFVPAGAEITDSPGTILKYRLPISGSPAWTLFGLLAFCLIWNALAAVFAAIAVGGHLSGRPDWFLTIFIVPFVLIGLAALVYFLRQLLIATGIGPTRMEISEHPLHPGGRYHAFVSQSGKLEMNSLRVWLTCEESAAYRQGTNSRTETREVFRRELFCREGFAIGSGFSFESEIEFEVPDGAMHSFAAKNNEINWGLVVEGDVAGWPNFRRVFSVIVRPIAGETGR